MIESLLRKAGAVAVATMVAVTANATPSNPCGAPANPCGAPANPCGAPSNPCGAPANPCGAPANPCAAPVNPCGGAMNPCGAGAMNPCSAPSNPCGGAMNPCSAAAAMWVDPDRWQNRDNVPLHGGNRARLARRGEALFNDPSLSGSGAMSCATCHTDTGSGPYAMMKSTFAQPYPHYVAMADKRSSVQSVSAAEMVQFCQIVPMQGEPLAWDSKELAALTAYVESIQPGYRPPSAAPSNPCAGRPLNPCGG